MKNKMLIGIVVILIIVTGCKILRPKQEDVTPEVVEYHIGKEGLVLGLIEGRPPKEIWPGSDFLVEVELRNKGAYDINNGVIKLHGFNPRYVLPSEGEKRLQKLKGKQLGYPEGDYATLQFEESNVLAPPGEEPLSFTVSAEYDYATEASAEICISPDLNPIVKTPETICEVKEINLKGGQGAPIAVTKINEIPSYRDMNLNLNFILDIENVGEGEVLGDIFLESVRVGGQVLTCDQPAFKLEEKKARIKCEMNIYRPAGPYTSVVAAKLSYRYKTKLDHKIKVIRID
jgi:hypothetical protein